MGVEEETDRATKAHESSEWQSGAGSEVKGVTDPPRGNR